MAFAYTVNEQGVKGKWRTTRGTYTSSAGGTGGDIVTGLKKIYKFVLQPNGAAVATNASVVNEVYPRPGTVTIVTDADQVGAWEAEGYL